MSKQLGRLAPGPQSHGAGVEVSARSLALRAPSRTEQGAAGKKGKNQWDKERDRKRRMGEGCKRGSKG